MCPRRRDLWVLASVLSVLFLVPRHATAIYFYLDSNGDGVRTEADVLQPRGVTHVTLYLVTNQSIKGTDNDCSHATREGGARGYSIVFRASSGTVVWGKYVAEPNGEPPFYESDDSTYFFVRRGIGNWDDTHPVKLGTFDVRVRRGRPAIDIVDQCPLHDDHTTRIDTGTYSGPATKCSYGLPYGGQANRPPSLTPLADEPIHAGSVERLTMQALDPDRDPVTYRLVQGPPFVSVMTIDRRTGIGEIRAAPDSCTRGDAECVIEVSDGFATDTKRMHFKVLPVVKQVPKTPMEQPIHVDAGVTTDSSPFDSTWLRGEWERSGTIASWVGYIGGPAQRGYRRRLVFRANGRLDMFDIGPGSRILRAEAGTYSVRGRLVTITNWIGRDEWGGGGLTYNATRRGRDVLEFYPAGVSDGSTDVYIRVPPVCKDGAAIDTSKVLVPVEPPSIRHESDGIRVLLPKPMQDKLRASDPSFRPWVETDSRALGYGPAGTPRVRGSSAILGDFDGDLLPDVALLGRSGADEVVVALLSDFGRIRAAEVAWRRVTAGEGQNKSRGDPHNLTPIYLELAPRGTSNPFCWTSSWQPTPLDAVGIVEPGIARFDYVFFRDRFLLFGPAEGTSPYWDVPWSYRLK